MTDKKTYITKEGLQKLMEELDYLKSVKRLEIAERIREAKELGDLSENAEYTEAKETQAFNEGRVLELEAILRNVTVIEAKVSSDKIIIGSTIEVKNQQGAKQKFTIVGTNEIDPSNGKISNESPMGQSFLNKKIGDKVAIEAPRGRIEYEILAIK